MSKLEKSRKVAPAESNTSIFDNSSSLQSLSILSHKSSESDYSIGSVKDSSMYSLDQQSIYSLHIAALPTTRRHSKTPTDFTTVLSNIHSSVPAKRNSSSFGSLQTEAGTIKKKRKKKLGDLKEKTSCTDKFCSNPCCCFNQETGVKIVAGIEFVIGGSTVVFGLWCSVGTEYFWNIFGDDDIHEDELKTMVKNIGWSYVAVGFATVLLAFLLLRGAQGRKRRYCQVWGYAKVAILFIHIFGMVGGSLMLQPEESSAVFTTAILILLSIPLLLLPFQLYFIYIVSLYSVILTGVEKRLELMAKHGQHDLHSSSKSTSVARSPIEVEDDELSILLAPSSRNHHKSEAPTTSASPAVTPGSRYTAPEVTTVLHTESEVDSTKKRRKTERQEYEPIQSWRDVIKK